MLAEYPFTPKSYPVQDGHIMSYLDEGEGPVLVLLHGNPSWSYLYRNVVTLLKEQYRLIVPDHIGCGFSEKPPQFSYRLQDHIDNIEALLDHLEIKQCILGMHDWGGAIGMGWATRFPEKIRGLVVFNTAAFRSQQIPWRINICRLPFLGKFLVQGLNGFAVGAVQMAVTQPMKSGVAKGFIAPYNNWRNRIATHRFITDIPLAEDHPSYGCLQELEKGLERLQDKPMIIFWGGRDFCFNDSFYKEWQQRFPEAVCHYYPDAGHYVLEDAFAEISESLQEFLDQYS
jgi:haloalkane dehalogenase